MPERTFKFDRPLDPNDRNGREILNLMSLYHKNDETIKMLEGLQGKDDSLNLMRFTDEDARQLEIRRIRRWQLAWILVQYEDYMSKGWWGRFSWVILYGHPSHLIHGIK